jgi:AcrR family transcriptional regulator
MAKKRTNAEQSKESIVHAAEALVRRRAATGVTVEQVAKEAGCAKGLVHYHFKTKRGVLEAVAKQLATVRQANWVAAFRAPDARTAIDQTWTLLTNESDDGTILAWNSLFGPGKVIPGEMVSRRDRGRLRRRLAGPPLARHLGPASSGDGGRGAWGRASARSASR